MADEPETKPATPAVDTPPPAPPAGEAKADKDDWRIIELGQTRRQLEERQAELQRVQDENRRYQALLEATQRREAPPSAAEPPSPYTPPAPVPPSPSSPDFNQRVSQEVEQRLLNERAGQLDAALRTDFAEDYQAIINNFSNVQNSMRTMFNDILATGEGAYVAATVGKDPARIQQLRDLPEAQRRMALLRIALDKPKPTSEAPRTATSRPSEAPPPPSPPPRGGAPGLPTGAVDLYDARFNFQNYYERHENVAREKAADDTWYEERKRQKLESTGRAWSLRR